MIDTKKHVIFCSLDSLLDKSINDENFSMSNIRINNKLLKTIKTIAPEYVFVITNVNEVNDKNYNIYDLDALFKYVLRCVSNYMHGNNNFEYCDGMFSLVQDKEIPYFVMPNTKMLSYLCEDIKYTKPNYLFIGCSKLDKQTAKNFEIDFEYMKNIIKLNTPIESEYNAGDFLYGIPDSLESEKYNPENERVFIHNGYKFGDGYGILVGWNDGKIKKSTGYGNFCWGAKVRKATPEEIKHFMFKLMEQENIRNY